MVLSFVSHFAFNISHFALPFDRILAVMLAHEHIAGTVLLVDRDPSVAHAIMDYLSKRAYATEWVDDGEKAFNVLDARLFDILITELNVPRVDGLRLMAVAKERNPDMCVIFIAPGADIELATEAMRQGAYDFQSKPINLGKLEAVIQRGLEYQRLARRQYELRRRLDEHYGLASLIGNSLHMVRIYNAVRQAAPLDTPILIVGEPGTGKDLTAQAIHNNSPRRDEPFVKVDCATNPERLEADLFGYASSHPHGRAQRGLVEAADKGTLFLDQITALNEPLQRALVDVIEQRRTKRIGATRAIPVNVRVIASATHPIADAVIPQLAALIVNTIEIAPLRDRQEDIPILAQHFLREAGASARGFTQRALDLLMRYPWPDNVRELKNVVQGMAVIAKQGQPLDLHDVPAYIRRHAEPASAEIRIPIGTPMAEIEKTVIEETMKSCAYKKEACAKILGIGLRTLYRKLNEYE